MFGQFHLLLDWHCLCAGVCECVRVRVFRGVCVCLSRGWMYICNIYVGVYLSVEILMKLYSIMNFKEETRLRDHVSSVVDWKKANQIGKRNCYFRKRI